MSLNTKQVITPKFNLWPEYLPDLQNHIYNCLHDTSTWKSNRSLKCHMIKDELLGAFFPLPLNLFPCSSPSQLMQVICSSCSKQNTQVIFNFFSHTSRYNTSTNLLSFSKYTQNLTIPHTFSPPPPSWSKPPLTLACFTIKAFSMSFCFCFCQTATRVTGSH